MIRVKYFARLREITGKDEEVIDQDQMTVKQLLEWIEEMYPQFDTASLQVAVNEAYALQEDAIKSGDVCALIPPVSGG